MTENWKAEGPGQRLVGARPGGVFDTWDAPPAPHDIFPAGEHKPPKFTHGAMLKAVLNTLNQHPLVAWAGKFNSGTFVLEDPAGRHRAIECNALPRGFACPDILGQLTDGRLLAVEVKVGKDTFRPGQQEFLAFVTAQGGVSFVARSVQDCESFLPAVPPGGSGAASLQTAQ